MPSFDHEKSLSVHRVAGVDEVGYGAWAGPIVVVAAVLHQLRIPQDFLSMINDSKKLSAAQRITICHTLDENPHWIHYHRVSITAETLNDRFKKRDKQGKSWENVLTLTRQAMAEACHALDVEAVLVDGKNRIPSFLPQKTLVSGDNLSFSIAIASIIAKVYRDRVMEEFHGDYPLFYWKTNKGYGTQAHQMALLQAGMTPQHRHQYCQNLFSLAAQTCVPAYPQLPLDGKAP